MCILRNIMLILKGYVDNQKCLKMDCGHPQQIINIIYPLKVNWCNKITKEMRGKDGEPLGLVDSSNRLSWLSPSSRLSQLPKSAKPTPPPLLVEATAQAHERLSQLPWILNRFSFQIGFWHVSMWETFFIGCLRRDSMWETSRTCFLLE